MFCPHCDHENIDSAHYCARCGKELVAKTSTPPPPSVTPVAPPQYQTYAAPSVAIQPVEYAGFWLRFVAYLIDGFLMAVVFAIIFAVLLGGGFLDFADFVMNSRLILLVNILGNAFVWLYFALSHTSKYQATLGKLAVGLAVTDIAHHRISFARATGRHFAKWISAVLLFIGYLMIGFTAKKQGLHDMLADTLVVKR
ncbi:RDD family protein [bacterium]|nr:RDD family protein [bacterium]MBU1636790.1 RDD family protein [bacterium]MBU1921104.1 RDD family protein [bacterium]